MASQYEISAKLIIDNKQSKKAIKEAIKEIDKLTKDNAKYQKYLKDQEKQSKNTSKATEDNAKSTNKLTKAVKANDTAYKSLFSSTHKEAEQIDKLTKGLGDNHKGNKQLINDITKTHQSLIKQNASVEKATNVWKEFGKQRGLVYRGGNLVSATNSLGMSKDATKNLETITKRTTQLGNVGNEAFKDYTNRVAELNTALNTGKITQQNFNKGLSDTTKYMKGTYGITVKQLGNGYSELITKVKDQDNQNKKISKSTDIVKKSTDGLGKVVKDSAKSYATLNNTRESLSKGLSKDLKNNSTLQSHISRIHSNLIGMNASVEKSNQVWSKFANTVGLSFNKTHQTLSSSRNDIRGMNYDFNNLNKQAHQLSKIKIQSIGDVNTTAIKELKSGVANLHQTLTKNGDVKAFDRDLKTLTSNIANKHNVAIKNMGEGYFKMTNRTNSAKVALREYTDALRTANKQMNMGTFGKSERDVLRSYRDRLGTIAMSATGHNYQSLLDVAPLDKEGKAINTLSTITEHLHKYSNQLGITHEQINSMTRANNNFKATTNRLGGSLADITNGTGNYNKLLTTTTRSQRMQNYAMQVAGLRYNALATSLGFVGGMLGTQLAMGFATARIEAVQFDQKAQQMFKTSKLNAKAIENVTNAVKAYARENRKLNTQGLEYTVAQVTKLNNLNEEQSKKIIPVVADITNMMRINGRTQEDSILAVNDALDGQFKRLQEIGVGGKEMLKSYGWNGNIEDKMSLIGALEKVSKVKGWSDLTKDITTLQDAYDVLGNTLDDVLTPAMAKVTPVVVDAIQAISGFISALWDAPVAVQGLVSVLGIAGIAFGKMKFEMLYAKIIGSEFLASLTGLDDGMYGITRSVGAVNMAVRNNALSFEEGARCLMDYHTTQIGATRTYREYSAIMNEITMEQQALTIAQETASDAEKGRIAQTMLNNEARMAELYQLRELETGYAKYTLAMNNLTASERVQLNGLQRKFKLNDAEIAQIAITSNAIDAKNGKINVNTIANRLNTQSVKEMNVAQKVFTQLGIRSNAVMESRKLALLGINAEQEMNVALTEIGISETQKDNVVKNVSKRLYSQLNKEQRKKVTLEDLEVLAKSNLNRATAQKIDLQVAEAQSTSLCALATRESLEAEKLKIAEDILLAETETELTGAITANTFAQHLNAGTLNIWIRKTARATLEAIKNAGATALMTAKFLLLTPEGWAVTGVMAVLATTLYNVFTEQMRLNKVFGDYKKLIQELPDKIKKLEDKLSKTSNEKQKKEIQEQIDYYKKLEDQIRKTTEARSEWYEKASQRVRKTNQDMINTERGRAGQKPVEYTGLESVMSEEEKINKWIGEFGDTAKVRNEKFNKQLKENGIKDSDAIEMATEYAQAQQDVLDALNKYDSEDTFTRWGAYWDNWWARMKMRWLEFKASVSKEWNDLIDGIGNFFYETIWGSIAELFKSPEQQHAEAKENRKNFEGMLDSVGINGDGTNLLASVITDKLSELFSGIDIGELITNLILPEPVSAEGAESTPFLESVVQRLGLNPQMFDNIKQELENGFNGIIDKVNWFINPANWFMGSDDSSEGGTIVDTMYNNIVTPLTDTFNIIKETIYNKALGVGSQIKNGIRDGVSSLTQPVAQKLQELANYISSGQAVNSAKTNMTNLAKDLIKRFSEGIGNLSKIVSDEMEEIKNAIANKIDEIGALAEKAGSVINKGLRKGDDINSPGLAARAVLGEMDFVVSFISSAIPSISSISQKAGEAISNNFGQQDLTQNLEIIKNNQDIIKSNDMASQNTSAQYGNMANTVGNTFGVMSDNAVTDMNNVASENAQYLAQMNSDTSTNMNQINKTHNDKLGTMQNSTLTATNSMTKAWGSMKNNIVNSATQIRNLSYQKFSSLHRSIASFYRQIQSATFNSGLPAGHYAGRTSRGFSTTRRSVSGGYAGHYSGRQDDDYLKLLKGLSRGTATNEDVLQFYNKYSIDCKGDDCYAGVNPSTHVNKQLNYAKGWNIKDPAMYGIRLPMSNKVKDFMNGNAPRITYGNFETYLGALLNERGFRGTYEFYFNSKRSNQQVWDDVRCNCFDGAELIMEIARDMGLSNVGMLHGDWKGIPHVCASVGGKIYDMTQFQDYGVFRGTAGVHFGGAGHTGKRIKWASHTRSAGHTTNNNNTKNNKIQITVTGNTFIGEEEYKKKMENIAEDVFYDKMSDNPCIGY